MSYTLLLSLFYLGSGVFIFLLGLTILRSGVSTTPTRATALMLFFAGVGPMLSATAILLHGGSAGEAAGYGSMVENFEYLWEFYFPSLLLFALTYPRESRLVPSAFLLALLVFAPYIFHIATIMTGDGLLKPVLEWPSKLIDRELTVAGRTLSLGWFDNILGTIFSTLIKLHRQMFLVVNMIYAGLAMYLLSRNMKVSLNPRVAGQLRTVLTGVTISLAGYTLAKIVAALPLPGNKADVSLALVNLALLAGGGSVAYAVIKQQFLGIRYIVRKSVMYGVAAGVFAFVYYTVVKPVADFFGQYSNLGEGAFETGFIVVTIIAFQPVFFRVEELLERLLIKGQDDPQARFGVLAGAIANVSGVDELEAGLRKGLKRTMDTSWVQLNLDTEDERFQRLRPVLDEIGEPVARDEVFELAGEGRLPGQEPRRRRRWWQRRKGVDLEASSEVATELVAADEVIVPIFKNEGCEGFVSLGEKENGLKYTSEEMGLLSVFSGQIGVALDNIRLLAENLEKKLLEEELLLARRVQSQLLPSEAPTIDGYEVSASTVPSRQVGGDYYSVEAVDDNTLALVVADVSGKGMPASLLMATLHAAVNSNEDARCDPALMMQRMNRLLFRSTSPEEFATVFYGVVDLSSGRMRYANAGHEFPFVAVGGKLAQLGESGIVLGCLLNFDYTEHECQLPDGGALVVYTDGVTDAVGPSGEPFGEARLKYTLSGNGEYSARSIRDTIISEVAEFSRDGDYHDDITLVVLKRA